MITVWVALENEAPGMDADIGDCVELVCQWGSARNVPEEMLSTVPGATMTPIAGGVHLASTVTDRFEAVAITGLQKNQVADLFPGLAFQDRYLPEFSPVVPTMSGVVIERRTVWSRQRGYTSGPRLLVQPPGAQPPTNYCAPQAMIRVDVT
ncbi:hypothetical protein [Williamsia sp. CHRR-6]|uniref:hypothetical protein n=1 Tax=Williamsia sp. CHRR-6 TaxID=2835871 RepID=UPI001BD9FBEE|nr:hypothetical protein [Williamsia sp. CHRR-6]MBT0566439.1 hypothetical protein [Williamsia sp. CHRR-6]